MSDRDLWEDLRSKSIADLNEVAEARLERSGSLSVIKAKSEPKVIEIAVAEGVRNGAGRASLKPPRSLLGFLGGCSACKVPRCAHEPVTEHSHP